MKRLVFDIETEPFSEDFINAKSQEDRIRFAPQMRVACVYDESEEEYRFYTPNTSCALVADLLAAAELVSFNGVAFDFVVLQRHYGLNGRAPENGKHIDMHVVMSERAGFRVSLDKAVRTNFGERKHTSGREMDALDSDKLREACASDVEQTYRLWRAYVREELKIPLPDSSWGDKSPRRVFEGDPIPRLPCQCPYCHDVGSIEIVEWEMDEISEGQMADYMAGLNVLCVCNTCGIELILDL